MWTTASTPCFRKLTPKQKIDLIGGEDSMFIRGEPSINGPRLKMSDGPTGVRTWGKDTGYAAGIGLAATLNFPAFKTAIKKGTSGP